MHVRPVNPLKSRMTRDTRPSSFALCLEVCRAWSDLETHFHLSLLASYDSNLSSLLIVLIRCPKAAGRKTRSLSQSVRGCVTLVVYSHDVTQPSCDLAEVICMC